MRRSSWLSKVRANPTGVCRRKRAINKPLLGDRQATFELLENRRLLALDYGDAPDTLPGTGAGNYNTLSTDNGPNHTIVVGLKLGATVDDDGGAAANSVANADDVNGALPDDEDGLTNPASDLVPAVGALPRINVRVTNTTGRTAILYGWIDYNNDGVFENGTERASLTVPNGTGNLILTLVFPAVSTGFTGKTYARFRLSSDPVAANPTGAAADGEVEDYRVEITRSSDGTVNASRTKKITHNIGGNYDYFGRSVASLGDLDGDGVTDLAVANDSQVRVMYLNSDGTVRSSVITANGNAVASLGDLDGDGIADLAVGSSLDNTGGTQQGAVHVLLMNSDGTVKTSQKIAHNVGGGPSLANTDLFGHSLASLGDLDGDGVTDLAVGAKGTGGVFGGDNYGAVHVLFLNANGTVKAKQRIGVGTGPSIAREDLFGSGLASLGDLDGDGVADLAVGAPGDDAAGSARGSVHVLFMNANGTVKSAVEIFSEYNGGPVLANGALFGYSIAPIGDLDGDGYTDLAVGSIFDDTGGDNRGAAYLLMMNSDGMAKSHQKIASDTGGGPTLLNAGRFGASVSSLGDLDGDGVTDLAVGASFENTFAIRRGAVYVLFLKPASLTGDYNLNGVVDAADYVVWRKAQGTIVPPSSGADGDGNSIVDEHDYGIWRTNFGRTLPLSSSADASFAGEIEVRAPNESQPDAGQTIDAASFDDVGTGRIRRQSLQTSTIASGTAQGHNATVRSKLSDSTIVARLRDNALLSWLRDHVDTPRNRFEADFGRGPVKQNANQAPSNNLFDELDQVFGLLITSNRIQADRS